MKNNTNKTATNNTKGGNMKNNNDYLVMDAFWDMIQDALIIEAINNESIEEQEKRYNDPEYIKMKKRIMENLFKKA
jgi:hypothetical protein